MTTESQHAAVQRLVPVLQIIGYKNSGKTTLACRLIEALSVQGLRVGSAKHDAHLFQLDDPETDSSKHLLYGAVETVLTSPEATRVMRRSAASLRGNRRVDARQSRSGNCRGVQICGLSQDRPNSPH
ncbi:molybdopterin-guanine dinucleotide biosynthesis protein B [Paenibacillus rhizoplanae]